MAVERKSKKPVKVSLPWRFERTSKFRTKENNTHILNLPNEILLRVFSNFSSKELFCNLRPVCRRFKELTMAPTLWKEITIQNEVATNVLTSWIKSSSLLRKFTMANRTDTNIIAEELSKNSKQLESIKVENCWGSPKSSFIHSVPLCNLITRCPNLCNFDFSQIRFMSQKFFRLMSRNKRTGKIMKKCNYIGPMTVKQMSALFSAMCDGDTVAMGNINQKIKLPDIIRHFQEHNLRQINLQFWEPLNDWLDVHEVIYDKPMQVHD